MDGFRFSLLVIGIVVVLMIYFMGRRREAGEGFSVFAMIQPVFQRLSRRVSQRLSRRDRERDHVPRDEGDLRAEDLEEWDKILPGAARDEEGEEDFDLHIQAVDNDETTVADGEEFILVLRVLAHEGERFTGTAIRDAAQSLGMRYGDMDIFHLYTQVQPPIQPRVICSLANGVEPGHFRLDELEELSTPGVTLFLQLPGPLDGREAFEKMLELGRRLAQQLGGELYDESRSVLTAQTISHLKEKLEAWRFKTRMAQIRRRHH